MLETATELRLIILDVRKRKIVTSQIFIIRNQLLIFEMWTWYFHFTSIAPVWSLYQKG